jgi:RNA recognition motif-containing protein
MADQKKLFVAGVSWNTTDDAFHNFFAGFGTIAEAQLKREPGTNRSRGFGFVKFADDASAQKVLSQRLQLDGRKLDIKVAVPKEQIDQTPLDFSTAQNTKLYVAGLSYDTGDDAMFNYFARFGDVERASVVRDKQSGRSRGFGFVSFTTVEAANAVLAKTDLSLDGRNLDIKPAAPRGSRALVQMTRTSKEMGEPKKLFVAGLDTSTNEETFKAYFQQFGTVGEAYIQKDRATGTSRGFGFVEFEDSSSAKKALEHPGHNIDGSPVDCKVAIARNARPGDNQFNRGPPMGGMGGGYDGGWGGAPQRGFGGANPYQAQFARGQPAPGGYGRGGQGGYGAPAGNGYNGGGYGGRAGGGASAGLGQQSYIGRGSGAGVAGVDTNVGLSQFGGYGAGQYDDLGAQPVGHVGASSAGSYGQGYGGSRRSPASRAYHPYSR